jgi:hypothetical protein
MDRGYVREWRKTLDSQVFANAELYKVWRWCNLRANWKESWVSVRTGRGETQVKLQPGQFIFGREEASKQLRMKPSSVRNRIRKLVDMGNLDIQPDTHFSIVTVVNYELYNDHEIIEGQQTGTAKDNQRTTKGQPKDTEKNSKNSKHSKKGNTASRFTPPTVEEVTTYCKERNNGVDAQRFVDFYSSKGWMVGKNRMKDWQASVRTWEKDSRSSNEQKPLNLDFDPEKDGIV